MGRAGDRLQKSARRWVKRHESRNLSFNNGIVGQWGNNEKAIDLSKTISLSNGMAAVTFCQIALMLGAIIFNRFSSK